MNAAHDRWWQISEVVFGVPLLVALLLQVIAPISIPYGSLALAFILAGVAIFILGVWLISQARRELAQRGQPTDPGRPTSSVVTSGVFSFSRNPLYLGCVFLVAGIGLAFDLPWVLVSILPAVVACHYVLIAPEERYLAARFGKEYTRYMASVHRWIFRK